MRKVSKTKRSTSSKLIEIGLIQLLSASFTPMGGEQPATVKIKVSDNNSVAMREAIIIVSDVIKGSGQVKIRLYYHSQGSIASSD